MYLLTIINVTRKPKRLSTHPEIVKEPVFRITPTPPQKPKGLGGVGVGRPPGDPPGGPPSANPIELAGLGRTNHT